MNTTTGCNRECGAPVDLTAPHVTLVLATEQHERGVIQVQDSHEVAYFHPDCAPSVDDVLDGLIDAGHLPATGGAR